MKSSQVRDLARRYATGKLSQESYRSQRRSLIDSITTDRMHLAYRQDERAVAARPRFNTKLLGVAMVAILVAGICGILFLRHGGKAHGAQAATAPNAPVAPPPAPGPDLVQQFVDTDDWTDGNIQNFERRWTSLSADEQAKAKGSSTYPRLVSAVRLQITSEKAVAGDAAAKDPHLAELQKLSKTLGVTAGP
ncbi:MAG TPA: hypothetical protein VGH71_03835 [Gammaproteobacteria bacterium]|jgi:hypothetical protein